MHQFMFRKFLNLFTSRKLKREDVDFYHDDSASRLRVRFDSDLISASDPETEDTVLRKVGVLKLKVSADTSKEVVGASFKSESAKET